MNSKDIFNLTLFTVITSVAWLGISAYSIYFKKENSVIESQVIKPVDLSKFDQQILDALETKVNYYK